MGDVEVVVDWAAVSAYFRGPQMRAIVMDAAVGPVGRARAGAPRATGAGADSIHAEPVLEGPSWTAQYSWDREHYYMSFHQLGTRSLPARPFLVPSGM
jgi:hypothetical protein